MSDNYELFVKKKALIKHLRQRKCPAIMEHWGEFSARHKVFRLKSEKAFVFLNHSVTSKAFNALRANCEERKDYRNLYRKAYLFHCEKLIIKSLMSLKEYKNYSKDIREKRTILEHVIHNVDIDSRKLGLIKLLKNFNTQTEERVTEYKNILAAKKKQRFLNYIRYYKNKRADLKVRYNALKEATEKRIKHRFILHWVRQYDIEWNIKDMKIRREHNIMINWFCACLREVNVNKSLTTLVTQKQNETQVSNI